MNYLVDHQARTSRLPKRLPVGTTYVVEGFGGNSGHLRIVSRYLILPNGQRVNVPEVSSQLASPRAPRGFARRHSPKLKRSQVKTPSAGGREKIAGSRGTG